MILDEEWRVVLGGGEDLRRVGDWYGLGTYQFPSLKVEPGHADGREGGSRTWVFFPFSRGCAPAKFGFL
jgi:hypothetical protein